MFLTDVLLTWALWMQIIFEIMDAEGIDIEIQLDIFPSPYSLSVS